MSILEQLASSGERRNQEANVAAAAACIAEPAHIDEIVGGLGGKDARIAGDCAEVMTKIAERRPDLVAPHAETLFTTLRDHKNGRVRWESAHALALSAALAPEVVARAFSDLAGIAKGDKGLIVRDYSFDALAAYGATSAKAARAAWPVLRDGVDRFEGKHAARILAALPSLARADPKLADEAGKLAARFVDHPRAGVRKAAASAIKALAGGGKAPAKRAKT
ncbi:MAG TPA: hypothetical protein VHB21_08630 [Minicystis sp.]|nr:hypothetical protein [Minicystis sp.]